MAANAVAACKCAPCDVERGQLRALFDRVAYLMLSQGESPEETTEADAHLFNKRQRALVRDLQCVYDDFGPSAWPDRLNRVARVYQLEVVK